MDDIAVNTVSLSSTAVCVNQNGGVYRTGVALDIAGKYRIATAYQELKNQNQKKLII